MKQPLSDIRVVELGEMVSAPYAAKILADMGAEVIKVEPPREGDRSRRISEFPDYGKDSNLSPLFLYLNANKLGITLDISRREGFEILERLVAEADVLIHNLLPLEMERIGLEYERLRKINPALIMTSVLPFGLDGPYRNYRAEDLNLWSAGGAAYVTGGGTTDPDLPPLRVFGNAANYQGGVHAAVATMAALIGRDLNGEGQHIDLSVDAAMVSTMQTIANWMFDRKLPTRLQRVMQPSEPMECEDGSIFVQILEDHQWREFSKIMGDPEWAHEERFSSRNLRNENGDAMRPLLQDWIKNQKVLDLFQRAQAAKVPFAPVSTMEDLLESEHLKERKFFVPSEHPIAGTFSHPRGPALFSETPWELRYSAPTLGQHNEEIFIHRLHYSAAEVDQLKEKGII